MRKQTYEEANARRSRVLEAASTIFFRYGYSRTTIGDIAQEAKLHRPALYALFPEGKEELFEAVLFRLVESEVDGYRKEIKRFRTLRQKTLFCVQSWSMGGFRLTEAHSDARDAFNMAYPAVRKMYEVLTSFYAELLRDAVIASPLRMSAEEFARLLIFSLRGIKDIAQNAETLNQLLIQEVDLFLAALSAQKLSSQSSIGRRSRPASE